MKKQLLKRFYAFIILAMFSFSVANAQIVYTDIIPDTTFLCLLTNSSIKTYHLDLNNDGTNDFNIISVSNYAHLKYLRVAIIPQEGNSYITNSINTAKKIFVNDTIGLAQVWNDTTTQNLRAYTYVNTHYVGEWINETNKYLGLELIVAGQVYFGWARLDVNVDSLFSTFTIKDYAYNSTPNQFILAGDTGTGLTGIIENIASSSLNIFPNPVTNNLTITLNNYNKKIELIISNITGKIIYATTIGEAQKLEITTRDFSEGVYFVQSIIGNAIETKKLIILK